MNFLTFSFICFIFFPVFLIRFHTTFCLLFSSALALSIPAPPSLSAVYFSSKSSMGDSKKDIIAQLEELNKNVNPADRDQIQNEARTLTDKLQAEINSQSNNSTIKGIDSRMQQQFIQSLKQIEIDEGIFKYVLIHVPSFNFYLIRGKASAAYHYECALDLLDILTEHKIHAEVLGGGRMNHNKNLKKLEIYGFSYSYGMADHALVGRMLQDMLGEDYEIHTKNTGY